MVAAGLALCDLYLHGMAKASTVSMVMLIGASAGESFLFLHVPLNLLVLTCCMCGSVAAGGCRYSVWYMASSVHVGPVCPCRAGIFDSHRAATGL